MADTIANPVDSADLFPDIQYAMIAEEAFKRRRDIGSIPAADYLQWKESIDWDVVGGKKKWSSEVRVIILQNLISITTPSPLCSSKRTIPWWCSHWNEITHL